MPHQDVIKNPNRTIEANIPEYVPEYVKLGITPILQDFSSLDGELLNAHTIENLPTNNTDEQLDMLERAIPNINDFILMVYGHVIICGNLEFIMKDVKALLYGTHPDYLEHAISPNDIILLKRVGLKIGVFVDE